MWKMKGLTEKIAGSPVAIIVGCNVTLASKWSLCVCAFRVDVTVMIVEYTFIDIYKRKRAHDDVRMGPLTPMKTNDFQCKSCNCQSVIVFQMILNESLHWLLKWKLCLQNLVLRTCRYWLEEGIDVCIGSWKTFIGIFQKLLSEI